jgi:hypothetical protein
LLILAADYGDKKYYTMASFESSWSFFFCTVCVVIEFSMHLIYLFIFLYSLFCLSSCEFVLATLIFTSTFQIIFFYLLLYFFILIHFSKFILFLIEFSFNFFNLSNLILILLISTYLKILFFYFFKLIHVFVNLYRVSFYIV